MLYEPVDGLSHPVAEWVLRPEAEQPFGTTDVQPAARLTIRLSRVPDDFAAETDLGRNEPGDA